MAGRAADRGRRAGSVGDPLSAGQGWPFPRRRVQGRRRRADRSRTARRRDRRGGGSELGGGPRTRGTADRTWRRVRGRARAARQAGRAGAGDYGCRRVGQLRRDQHPARVTAAGRVSVDGSDRAGRGDVGGCAAARPARGRCRFAGVPRPRLLDRVGNVLVVDIPTCPTFDHPTLAEFGCGDRDRGGGRVGVGRDSPARAVSAAAGRTTDGAGDAGDRAVHRGARDPVRAGDREQLVRGAVFGPIGAGSTDHGRLRVHR